MDTAHSVGSRLSYVLRAWGGVLHRFVGDNLSTGVWFLVPSAGADGFCRGTQGEKTMASSTDNRPSTSRPLNGLFLAHFEYEELH